jgi:hypothetical protein
MAHLSKTMATEIAPVSRAPHGAGSPGSGASTSMAAGSRTKDAPRQMETAGSLAAALGPRPEHFGAERRHRVELLGAERARGDDPDAIHAGGARQRSEAPDLPPVYSTTVPPGFHRPSASARAIASRVIRSWKLPVGFSHSSFAGPSAQPGGATLPSRTREAFPIACRTSIARNPTVATSSANYRYN